MPKNLKDILGDLEEQKDERQIKVTKDELLEETLAMLFEIYEKKLNIPAKHGRLDIGVELYKSFLKSMPKNKYNIGKKVMDEFVLRVANYEQEQRFSAYTGVFITAMMQTSFQQGHNNFELILTSSEPIHSLCYKLHGWQDRRLALKIVNCADYPKNVMQQPINWFDDMTYVDITILGLNVVPHIMSIGINNCTFTSDSESLLKEIESLSTDADINNKTCLLFPKGAEPAQKSYNTTHLAVAEA